MPRKSETTLVTVKLTRPQASCLDDRIPQIMAAFSERGMDVHEIRPVEGGLRIGLDTLSIAATVPPERPDEIRIVGTGEDDGAPGSPLARQRFHACATLARFFAVRHRTKRIEWRHRGGFYITENGRIAVVTGMRGTSGQGARRKSAARAFSLYGPDMPDRGTGPKRRRWIPRFRIGGSTRRSLPEKLSEAAVNTTVCVLSPPSGAALVTYSLLRGGSLEQSARWVAMTGIAAGFTSPHVMLALLH